MSNTFPQNINRFINELKNPAYEVAPVALFVTFSRFEYAMKRAGYAKGNSKKCEPDWNAFECRNKDVYNDIKLNGLLEARSYFNTMPPRKQVYIEGKLKWKVTHQNNLSDLEWHSILVRRVRNNLFHGEKTQAFVQIGAILPEQEEPSRNTTLIRHSLVMLEAFLECDNELKTVFHSFIPGNPA